MSAILSAFMLLAATPEAVTQCKLGANDREWLEGSLRAWPDAARRYLKSTPSDWPTMLVYDTSCRFTLTIQHSRPIVLDAVRYGTGGVSLPDGRRLSPGPHAMFLESGPGSKTVVMALPSVWASAPVPKDIPLPWLLEAALFHELAHVQQANLAPSASFAGLHRRGVAARSLHDDSIQYAYAADPSYAGLVSYERMLLNEAADATGQAAARRKACDAAKAIGNRRRRLATRSSSAPLAEIDEIATTSEGLGGWVAYRWLTEQHKVAPATAIAALGSDAWSQIIGLALFRALDRVSPGWEARILSEPPPPALALLEEACTETALGKR